jgi:hypothetical protein
MSTRGIQLMFAASIFPCFHRSGNIRKTSLVTGMFLILLLAAQGGYAMQPPPPPLNIEQLKMLVAKADMIIVGRVIAVKEAEGIVEATVLIEKLLKGKTAVRIIEIKETYAPASFQTPVPVSKDGVESPQMLTRSTAGPATYHGKYKKDGEIIVLLEKVAETNNYRPLGSGTYNKYLAEFLIENNGIKSREPDYFRFADDVAKFTATENKFTGLIKRLIKSDFHQGRE